MGNSPNHSISGPRATTAAAVPSRETRHGRVLRPVGNPIVNTWDTELRRECIEATEKYRQALIKAGHINAS